jgi:2-dehydro-3-deoxyphosphooctonate aldolase (KDO 8-P synthase)
LRDYIFPLARAACGVGIDGLFLEFHPEPERALCDAASMLPMARLSEILKQCLEVHSRVKGWPDS